MNSLVGYADSDDDSSEEHQEIDSKSPQSVLSAIASTSNEVKYEKVESLFKNVLPTKRRKEDRQEEELIVLPSQKELSLREKPVVRKGKIIVNLPKYESDSEDEECTKTADLKPKKFKHGSSLFQFLPEVKVTVLQKKKTLLPHSILNRKNANNNNNKNNKINKNNLNNKSGETDSSEARVDSGIYNADDDLLTNTPSSSSITTHHKPSPTPHTNFFSTFIDDEDGEDGDDLKNTVNDEDKNASTQASLYKVTYGGGEGGGTYDEELGTVATVENNAMVCDPPTAINSEIDFSQEDLLRLQGRGNQESLCHIIDVNLQDHIGDYEKQRLKDSTRQIDTTFYQSKNTANQPDAMQKRKHQMTYLAFQAKEREFELKNQWAENRYNKKQTQSKYGF